MNIQIQKGISDSKTFQHNWIQAIFGLDVSVIKWRYGMYFDFTTILSGATSTSPLIVCPHSLRDISGQRSPSQKAAFCLVFPQVLSIPATSRRDDNAIVFLFVSMEPLLKIRRRRKSPYLQITLEYRGPLARVCPKSMQNIKEHWEWLTKYTPFNTQGKPTSHSEMPKRVPRAPSKADLET